MAVRAGARRRSLIADARATWLLLALGCTALACTALAGCGQTGDLYLPDEQGEVVSTTAGATVDGKPADSNAADGAATEPSPAEKGEDEKRKQAP
jgi:predicted small lipoprotein YifL